MKDTEFAKFVVLVNGCVPLAMLAWDGYHHHLGADPITFAIHTTGMTALIFLMLSLAVTPLRLITGSNWYSNFRRMLGLFAFFYGLIHLTLYSVFNKNFDLPAIFSDVVKRPFILFGMTAFVLMVPLAITSTNGMIKRLGAARWKRLHQLVYVSGIAAVLHYLYFSKLVTPLKEGFIALLAILLLYRILVKQFPGLKKGRKAPPRSPAAAT